MPGPTAVAASASPSGVGCGAPAPARWTYGGYGGPRERLLLLWFALLEPLGYRQLTTIWRIRGLVKYTRGKNEWGVMTRSGFAAAEGAGEGTKGP